MMRITGMLGGVALLTLAACAEREVILPGERLDPTAVTSPDGPAVQGAPVAANVALALPGPQARADWTQRGGNAAHDPGHAALGAGLSRVMSAPIGQADGRGHRITADPVVAGGLVYTLDSRARVTATTPAGGRVWSTDVTPPAEGGDSASGGGLAFADGRVFATTGYGELVALDAATGGVAWRQKVGAPIGGGPAVADGTVYVAARNSVGWAVRAADGRVEWQTSGTPSSSGVMGVSVPAVAGDAVVFPFNSGQMLAVDRATGLTRYQAQVAGIRTGRAIATIRDVTGDPVIAGGVLYGGTSSGRTAAFDLATGTELWSARDGANSPPVVAGGSVFVVNDEAELVRLDAATGGAVWRVPLPYYRDARVKKQDRIAMHYGPVLAGGRLFVASSDGLLRAFDPVSGAPAGTAAIPGGAATAPVVAGQTLYVVGRDGNLHGYR